MAAATLIVARRFNAGHEAEFDKVLKGRLKSDPSKTKRNIIAR
jgi:hypothetical protein